MGQKNLVKIGLVRTEIFLTWTNVARTDVAWTNVTMRVGICQSWSQEPTLTFGQNLVSNSGDIPDMDKYLQDKCGCSGGWVTGFQI